MARYNSSDFFTKVKHVKIFNLYSLNKIFSIMCLNIYSRFLISSEMLFLVKCLYQVYYNHIIKITFKRYYPNSFIKMYETRYCFNNIEMSHRNTL